MKILVVDDNKDLLESLSEVLEMDGYAVKTAGTGSEALAVCEKEIIDLALIDIALPDVSGMDVFAGLREVCPDIECVIITGHASLDTAVASVGAPGLLSYEVKPLRMESLLNFIREVAARREAERSLKETEERVRSVVRNLPVGMFRAEAGAEGRIVMANPAFARLTGFASPAEIVGTRLAEMFTNPRDCAALSERLEREGEIRGAGMRMRRTDRTVFMGEFTARATRNADGNIDYIYGAVDDATERKRSERTLRLAAEGTKEVGDAFFPAMVKALADALDVPYAFVGEVQAPEFNKVKTIAMWAFGPAENIGYGLAGTPCDNVVGKIACAYPRDVQKLFPDDALLVEMDIQSYLGLPLREADGSPWGIIVVMDNKPFDETFISRAIVLMEIFGVRASAEYMRLKSDAALRASEEKYRTLFELSPLPVAIVGLDGRIIDVNDSGVSLMSGTREQAIGKHFVDIETMPPEDLPRYAQVFADLSTGKIDRLDDLEIRLNTPEGEKVILTSVAPIMINGRLTALQAVSKDITEKKKADEAIAEASRQWEATFNAIEDMIALVDADHNVLRANEAMLWTFGEQNVLGRKCHKLIHGTEEKPDRCPSCLAFDSGVPMRIERQEKHLGNQWFDIKAYPIIDRSGKASRLVHIFSNITDRKNAEEKLRKSESRLRALSRQMILLREEERAKLARELHDELGQKLTGLYLEIECLRNNPEAGAVFAESAREIIGKANDDLKRIYHGLRPVTLDKLGLSYALKALAREFAELGAFSVKAEIDDVGRDEVHPDIAINVYRVLQEALTNAARHSGADTVKVTFRKSDDGLVLETRDNGGGFAPEIVNEKNAFGIFGMIEGIEQFDGLLNIDSRPGLGTTITASFPAFPRE